MSLIAILANPRLFLTSILICMLVTLASAQSPRASSSVSSQSKPQTGAAIENAPVAANSGNATQQAERVKWTDVVIAIAVSLQLLISVVGFWLIWLQVKQLNRGIRGETHSRLYDHYLKVTERLAVESKLRPYFYDPKKELKEDDAGYADLREEIDMMCEIISGLLEHAAVQKENLPKDSWVACWQAYTYERFEKSVELRKFFRDNRKWYAESFRNVVELKYPHLVLPCGCTAEECTTEEAAKEKTCPKPVSNTEPAKHNGTNKHAAPVSAHR